MSKALLLIGSPKLGRSTSESLGSYFIEKLNERGVETESISVYRLLRSEGGMEQLNEAVDKADVLVLSFPLYADALPAGLVHALTSIADHRKASASPRKQGLVAVSNCGFPESRHIDTAIAVCRQFAGETGIDWLGGLALGAGGSLDGRPLAKAGGMVRNAIAAFDLAASDVAEGRPISDEAVAMMARPMMPSWMYTLFGNLGWRLQARKLATKKKLNDRPLQGE